MKLQRHEFIPGPMGGEMRAQDDGDWVEASEVEPLENVAQLILVSPVTGHSLEVQTEIREENGASVFQVGNQRESFEVQIRFEEV